LGGCSVGYWRAGFDVVGVDLVRQFDYPFPFILGDATTFDIASVPGVVAVHASPPCKSHTALAAISAARLRLFDPHPDLIPATRALLIEWGGAYVIENVVGAPLVDPVTLCGSSFGLSVRRHRLFESNRTLLGLPCRHAEQGRPIGVYGTGGAHDGAHGRKVAGAAAAEALGIDWSDRQSGLSQAIPPAYTEHLGQQLIGQL
jgi:DNA (cytosine-5)-methyltransferase 1